MAVKSWNGIKHDFKEVDMNFHVEHYVQKNRTTFSDVPSLLEIFGQNDPKRGVPYTFQPDFSETF